MRIEMPKQFMIKKWSPDKMNPKDDTDKTDIPVPYDLSIKSKPQEPQQEARVTSPVKVSLPHPGVIEFSSKIVTSNMSPSIGVAMINKDRLSHSNMCKSPMESWSFNPELCYGANWRRSSFMPYNFPFIRNPIVTPEFTTPVQTWRGGNLLAPTACLPMHSCFPSDSFTQVKDNPWLVPSEESASPISRPESVSESSKESIERAPERFSPVSSSTGSSCVQPPRYFCPSCNKSYATYSGLSRHKQFHCVTIEKKAFNCKYCNKIYVSLGALKMHIRTHTLPCRCSVCGKAFSRPWLLQGHLRTHTGEKPFSCPNCSRAFADRSNLRAHLQTHSDIKKYSCNSCNKTFSRMSLLMKHHDGGCGTVQRPNTHYIPIGVRT